MEEYPQNLMDLERSFSTEDACREYLRRLRWPEGFRCPACGHADAWSLNGGLLKCRGCGRKTSVIAGTIFEGTRKPLVLWFRAIWWVTSQKNGASALGLQRIIRYGQMTMALVAQAVIHQLRQRLGEPYATWDAQHIARGIFHGLDGDIRVWDDTIVEPAFIFSKLSSGVCR